MGIRTLTFGSIGLASSFYNLAFGKEGMLVFGV